MEMRISVLRRLRSQGERKTGTKAKLANPHIESINTFFATVFKSELPSADELMLDVDADVVAWTPEGPRISYSTLTAGWLARVAENPSDKGAVTSHLNSHILNGGCHPLRRVVEALERLLSRLFVSTAVKSAKGDCGADGATVALQAAAGS